MADEQQDDTVLDLTSDMEVGDPPEPDEDLSLEIEGEEAGEETPVVRQLRQRLRDSERELHEQRKSQMPQQQTEVGAKPDLWDDCEGDAEKFEAAYQAWLGRKRAVEDAQRQARDHEQARNQAFERARGKYQASAGAMKIKGFETAEKAVLDTLGPDFLGAMIQYADEPAKLIGALGNNPLALAKVAAEPDPMLQFKMLLRMETKIVAKRSAPPPPEADTIQRGTASVAKPSADKKLAQLEAQALKTGDRTAIREYRKANNIKA